MFKFSKKYQGGSAPKKRSNTHTSKVNKKPIFLGIGLVTLIFVAVAIYMLVQNFHAIFTFEYSGYAISGKEITETLLGNNSEEDNNKKSIFLTKVNEQDKLYKKLNDYFVGENKKEEINLNYPIYINNNTALYNLSQDIKLITVDFEEISGYPNLTVSAGVVYNQTDLERMDDKEYIFLKNENNIFTNLKEIKIQTTANEYIIPVNSNVFFDKEEIRYYEIKKDTLRYKEIKDIDTQSKVVIGEKEVSYEELLTALELNQTENQVPAKEEEIIEEDTSKENEKKQEEVQEEEPIVEEPEITEPGAYIKPVVTCSPFKAKVYTASTELTIKDPSSKILEPVTFIFRKDGRIYLRKTYTSSGEIEVKGLSPNTSYEIEGSYVYENEAGQKVENTFYKDSITTTGFENLDPITLSFENGEIFSNKIQLKNLKITSDIQNEAVKGIKRLEVEIGDVIYKLTGENLRKFIAGEAIVYETAEGMKSNQKVYYTIKLYDNQGNELRVENNRGETRTSKQKPSVNIRLNKQNVIEVEIGLNLNNKDNVSLENYRYQITRPNGEIVKEAGLKENDNSIYLNDLDPNQYYTITVYASYDLEDNKGKQENQVIGQTVFATQPLSTLGYLELNTNLTDVQTDSGTVEIGINEDRTDKRLIQILDEIKIELVELGKYEGGTSGVGETKEGNIIETVIITGEELRNLKQGEIKTQIFEDLISNTKYSLKITSKVKQGETIEEVQVTYSLKEIVTLKMPAEVQMKNLFVTGDLIDFDVRIEDIDKAVLTSKVRMELRDEKTNLIKLEEINTNEDYIRKTIEKLETGKTYTLSFYADQYNEGNTDETYKANYLLKELKIVTETGITGSIGLTNLSRKAKGKNLVDMSSEIKWYVYPNFNTNEYYGKEYNKEAKILTLGGHGNNRRAVYDLEEYTGQEVTMSFKAKLVPTGTSSVNSTVYIQNSKVDKNRILVKELTVEDWKNYEFTLTVDETGYLGFYILGGNGVEIQELQIELGNKKTTYEEYKYTLESEILVNLEDKKGEISTKDYYIKIYENDELIKEERYEEMNENNQVVNKTKTYPVKENTRYTLELAVKIGEREYVLDTQEFETEEGKEIKGIRNKEEFLEIQPRGNYIVLGDIDLTGGNGRQYRFGSDVLEFNGKIDFNGYTLVRDSRNTNEPIFRNIGKNGIVENLILRIKINNEVEASDFRGLFYSNYGEIKNIQVNLIESSSCLNIWNTLMGWANYGIISDFVIQYKEPIYVNYEGHAIASNYGEIKNGYIYGKPATQIGKTSRDNVGVTPFLRINEVSGIVRNIYTLTGVKFEDIESSKNIADLIMENRGIANNIYSVNINEVQEERMEVTGPNIYGNPGIIENSYYFYDEVFKSSYDTNTSKLALYDKNFQNQILNTDGEFEIEETVGNGYFPILKMPDVMPAQEYIKLPEVKDEDLPDIISSSIIEKSNNEAIIEMNVHNPSGETITEIGIQYLETEIESQEYGEGKSKVRVKVKNPTKYISEYNVIKLVTKGAYGFKYERVYKEKERIVKLDLYREINNIQDWKNINKLPTENYKLTTDLDFLNEGKDILITNTYTGIIDGGNHSIRNLKIEGGTTGLIKLLTGSIKNLRIENYQQIINNGSYGGIISIANSKSEITDIHIKNARIEIGEGVEASIGILNGTNNYGKIQNCSVSNGEIKTIGEAKSVSLGGLVGTSYYTTIKNSYVTDIEIEVEKVLTSKGIGGMVGANNSGTVQYCYTEGRIKTEKEKVGGIAGTNTGSIKNNYSKVNIETTSIYAGGIVGENQTKGDIGVVYNLYIGNIYSRGEIENRIVGNGILSNKNYGYKEQRVNGEKIEDPVVTLLSREEILKESSYENLLYMDRNFNYDELNKGILPKLYDEEKKELLPNQKDIKIEEEEIEIEEVYSEKADVNTGNIKITIKNKAGYRIEDVKIEDMSVEIIKNVNQDGKTYMDLKVKAEKYYDSYKIAEISYETLEGEKAKQEVEARVKLQFYKEITRYEDWQGIDGNSAQNYRLLTDIDFSGKVNPNYNVSIGRLEAPEEGHTIKNLSIETTQSEGLIKELKTSMKNINFENITIKNTTSGNYEGIIINNTAEIENISFKDITIDAPNMSYVSCIPNSVSNRIKNIRLERVKCYGNNYVAGFVSYMSETDCSNITGKEIEIEGKGIFIGGIFGRVDCPDYNVTQLTKNILIEDSNITGKSSYVGGAIGYGRINNITSNRNTIKGNSYVGGISGNAYVYNFYGYANVDSCKIYGEGSYIGGITGEVNTYYFGKVINSHIEGVAASSENVGGFCGSMQGSINNIEIINTKVISKGNIVGGVVGSTKSGNTYDIKKLYTKNCYIEGNNNVGGIIGCTNAGNVYNNYSNAEIVSLGENVGGIVGYAKNLNTANIYYNRIAIYNNNVAGSKVTGKENVGGLIGKVDKELYSEEQFVNNYVEAYLTGENSEHVSLGIGSNKEYNERLKNMHIYQYSTINEENINTENDTWKEEKYLKEADLKLQSTYTEKLKWSTSDWDYSVLANNKYPILKGIADQEGIDIPKDSEHMVEKNGKVETMINEQNTESNTQEISEIEKELPYEVFSYAENEIALYENATIITAENGTKAKREEQIYVKDGKLYVLDGNLPMKVDQVILDSYNGKEYETILGTDGKLYDLKEPLHYPQNFVNENIKSITNNLHTEYKITTVTYQDGSTLKFNYQTGKVIEENKIEKEESIWEYIRKQLSKKQELIDIDTANYEESNELIRKLEELPVEEAIEQENNRESQGSVEEIFDNIIGIENQELSSKYKDHYLTSYDSKTQKFVVYKEEDLLNVNNKLVETENEKIEKNNLTQYAIANKVNSDNRYGIIWIIGIIIAILIGLAILNRRKNK